MRHRRLGKTDMEVSVVCCGCMALAEGPTYGTTPESLSVRAIETSIDTGVNFFDTAEMYGHGQSEEVLGKALRGKRDGVYVSTKVSPEHLGERKLIAACEGSLQRLGTDYIDLYMVHWPNHEVPFEETARALEDLRSEGKIRAIGVSNFGTQDLSEAMALCDVQVNQLPYSLLWRAIERELVDVCLASNVSVLCYCPLARGILAGKFPKVEDIPDLRKRERYCRGGLIELTFGVVDELRAVSDETGEPMAAIALAWLAAQPAVGSVIAGMRSEPHARTNARAADLELGTEILRRLTEASQPLKDALDANPDMWREGPQSRYR